jgi:hypothetical protein
MVAIEVDVVCCASENDDVFFFLDLSHARGVAKG